MTRARVGFAAAFVATALFANMTPAGQGAPAPDLQPVLAGRKFMPPVKGEAVIEYTVSENRPEGRLGRHDDHGEESLTSADRAAGGQRGVVPEGRRRAHGRKSRDQRPAAAARDSDHDDHRRRGKPGWDRSSGGSSHAGGDVKLNLVKTLEVPEGRGDGRDRNRRAAQEVAPRHSSVELDRAVAARQGDDRVGRGDDLRGQQSLGGPRLSILHDERARPSSFAPTISIAKPADGRLPRKTAATISRREIDLRLRPIRRVQTPERVPLRRRARHHLPSVVHVALIALSSTRCASACSNALMRAIEC